MRRVSDLEDYIRSVEQKVRSENVDPQTLIAGQYEGLQSTGPARLRPLARETEKHHSGYLLGHLVRWMHARGRVLDRSIVGATLYGSAVAHAEAQRALSKDDGVTRAHQYAAIMAEKKRAAGLAVADERMAYAWLCEQADVVLTQAMVARLERIRVKRHERYGFFIGGE
jgi:hypothetical protein